MNLSSVILLLCFFAFAFQFWRIREISEAVNHYASHYCNQHSLQLLSVARSRTRLSIKRGKLNWHSLFIFEFSSDGQNSYQGTIETIGHNILKTDVPAYRV